MQADQAWDWEPGARTVLEDATACAAPHEWVEEPEASPDGERLAEVVNLGDGRFSVCVNGEPWETDFEKAWYLRFSPDGRLTAVTMEDGMWTVSVDGQSWEESFDFAWGTCFASEGWVIAA